MLTALLLTLLAGTSPQALTQVSATAQKHPSSSAKEPAAPAVVEITLERKNKNGNVEPVASSHVFAAGDILRLRLRSHYTGFLYVLDQGTSGQSSTIFPATDPAGSNRIRAGEQYLVPAVEDGWFEVTGPAGFDVLYFLLSPIPLATPAAAAFAAPGPASTLRPRCNDAIFRARGECTDDSAGPAALPPNASLPPVLAPLAHNATRDLVFIEITPGTTTVAGPGQKPDSSTAAPDTAPVLYTFRLAHQ